LPVSQRLRLAPLLLLLASLAAWSAPAAAQQSPAQPAETPAAESQAALDALLKVLKDEQARQDLIRQLEALEQTAEDRHSDAPNRGGAVSAEGGGQDDSGSAAPASESGTTEVASGEAAAAPSSDERPALALRIAEITQQIAEEAVDSLEQAWLALQGLESLTDGIEEWRLNRIENNGPGLLITIITTIVIVRLLTLLFSRLLAMATRKWDLALTLPRRVALVAVNAVTDLIALGLAYAAGYTLAFTIISDGLLTIEQSLYLNAFIAFGAIRVVIRLFVLPDRPDHVIWPIAQKAQETIHNWVIRVTGFLVYGITAAVPLANVWVALSFGRALRVIVATLGAVLALIAIKRIAKALKAAREAAEEKAKAEAETTTSENGDFGDALADVSDSIVKETASFWQRIWPSLAILYVLVAYVLAMARPALMADLIPTATAKTIVAGLVIAIAFALMEQAKKVKVKLPGSLDRVLPRLAPRLDIFVPFSLRLLALVFLVVALLLLLDAWQVIHLQEWLADPSTTNFLLRVLSAVMVATAIVLVWAVISAWIDARLHTTLPGRSVGARTRTLLSLFKNAFTIMVVIFGGMMALSEVGIDIAPLLAGAGVVGLAIGFGAQKLVQDIITGIFIQLENAINEGDVVTAAGVTGVVEHLTLRSVGLRDLSGVYHIVPFSAVDTVSNFMRQYAFHVADIGVAYKENIGEVKEAMKEAFKRLRKSSFSASIIGDMEMHGVVQLADSAVVVRARIRTRPGDQWAVGRAYTEYVKEVFDERDIEIPYPHRKMVYDHPAGGRGSHEIEVGEAHDEG